jgi:putative Ca2+/H+ antiporter (TMEM165/GDT1 family)
MQAFLVSLGAVTLAEIGDKTQLLALLLAVRFRAPWQIVGGIFGATVVNHLLAAWVGTLIAAWLTPNVLAWTLAVSFIVMGLWTLIPDKHDEEPKSASRFGPFLATLIAFFLVEMGDKTQIATVALAARFDDFLTVAAGTTLGMLVADVPVVFLGGAAAKRLPLKLIRALAACVFLALGVVALLNALHFW